MGCLVWGSPSVNSNKKNIIWGSSMLWTNFWALHLGEDAVIQLQGAGIVALEHGDPFVFFQPVRPAFKLMYMCCIGELNEAKANELKIPIECQTTNPSVLPWPLDVSHKCKWSVLTKCLISPFETIRGRGVPKELRVPFIVYIALLLTWRHRGRTGSWFMIVADNSVQEYTRRCKELLEIKNI